MSSHQRWLDHHTSRKHTAHGGSSRFVSRMSPSPAPGNCRRLTRRRRHKRVVPLFLWKYLMSLISETQQTDGWAGIVSATVRGSLSPAVAASFQDSSSGRAFDWLHACGFFCYLMRDETQEGKSNITMKYFSKVNMRNLPFAFVVSIFHHWTNFLLASHTRE